MDNESAFSDAVAELAILILVGGLLCSFSILGYEFYQWLKTGSWPTVPVSAIFNWLEIGLSWVSEIGWLGIRKIVIWILGAPLWAATVVFALIVTFLLNVFVESGK